jgi:hypothetical protein
MLNPSKKAWNRAAILMATAAFVAFVFKQCRESNEEMRRHSVLYNAEHAKLVGGWRYMPGTAKHRNPMISEPVYLELLQDGVLKVASEPVIGVSYSERHATWRLRILASPSQKPDSAEADPTVSKACISCCVDYGHSVLNHCLD